MFVPAVFELSSPGAQRLAVTEYGIVGLSAIEYFSAFILAPEKLRFCTNAGV